jgi:hypothetical protein
MQIADIVKALAEGKDLDIVLQEFLEGAKGEDARLDRLLSLFREHAERRQRLDAFNRYIWEHIEKNPDIWQDQYTSIEQLKDELGYKDIVLGPKTRMEREEQSVLKFWKVFHS